MSKESAKFYIANLRYAKNKKSFKNPKSSAELTLTDDMKTIMFDNKEEAFLQYDNENKTGNRIFIDNILSTTVWVDKDLQTNFIKYFDRQWLIAEKSKQNPDIWNHYLASTRTNNYLEGSHSILDTSLPRDHPPLNQKVAHFKKQLNLAISSYT